MPLTSLTLPHFVPVKSHDLDFQCHMSFFFLCVFNGLEFNLATSNLISKFPCVNSPVM
jgi:hypothetical protein